MLAVEAELIEALGIAGEATRVGVRPMPRDQRPTVGGIPGLDGFYVAAPRLAPYRPARFL